MAPLAVVKAFDIFLYGCASIGPGGVPLMMDELVFQATPEALHRRIVEAVSSA